MKIERRWTSADRDAYDGIAFAPIDSEVRNPDGSVVQRLAGVEVPAAWSQVAADVLAQKYLRKAGLPAAVPPVRVPAPYTWMRSGCCWHWARARRTPSTRSPAASCCACSRPTP
jgi:ribonucleoside-diphosphate reductase alpha chain